jgi:hypothetical protein
VLLFPVRTFHQHDIQFEFVGADNTQHVRTASPSLQKANLAWRGWHAFRRGLATNLHRLEVSDKVIQQILRHPNVSTTMNIYVRQGVPTFRRRDHWRHRGSRACGRSNLEWATAGAIHSEIGPDPRDVGARLQSSFIFNRGERRPPSMPTTHLRRACREASAWVP